MTKSRFIELCAERTIDPRIAFETMADAIRGYDHPDLNDEKAIAEWLDANF